MSFLEARDQLDRCPIWKTPLMRECSTTDLSGRPHEESAVTSEGEWLINSPRCAGRYSILNVDIPEVEQLSDCEKARLTLWLIEQRRLGNERPKITREEVERAKQRNDMSVPNRADAILKYLKLETQELGRPIKFSRSPWIEELTFTNESFSGISLTREQKSYYNLLAYSGSSNHDGLEFLLGHLKRYGWIELEYNGVKSSRKISCLLTVEGHARLEKIQQATKTDSSISMNKTQDAIDTNGVDDENIRVFISYSWDDEDHKQWVRNLAERLRNDGIEAILDQWELIPGDQVPHFMDKNIRESRYVLIVCTPSYCKKSNDRRGGVGYEGDVMAAEVSQDGNHRKFIPVLAKGSRKDVLPSWLRGKLCLDLSTTENYEEGYSELKSTLLGKRPTAPPVRRRSPNGQD